MKKILLTVTFVLSTLLTFGQGYSLDFDGGDYVDCGNDASVQIEGSTITLEAWIYSNDLTGNPYDNSIIDKHGSGGNDGYVLRCGNSNTIGFNLGDGGSFHEITSASISTGQWYHVAGVYNGTRQYLYVNGELVAQSPGDDVFTISDDAANLSIGYGASVGRYFDGKIDEVRVWSVARTEGQIKAYMNRELVGDEAGLEAYYQMSNGSGNSVTDNSNNTNDGTLGDGATATTYPTWASSGCFAGPGNALSFTAASSHYVEITDNDALDLTDNFTLEAWINPATFEQLGGILSKYNTGSSAGFTFRLSGDDTFSGLSFNQYETADAILTQNEWQHVAAVKNGGSYSIYLNGVEQALDAAVPYAETGNADPVCIGVDFLNGGDARYFNGQIDEVRIWNDVRTEDELRQNMYRALEGTEANLVAYYRMDQQDGATAYDLTNNGHNGTLEGPPTWASSSAFNTWLGGTSSTWTETTNWSLGTEPAGEGIGVFDFDLINSPAPTSASTLGNIYIGRPVTLSEAITVSGDMFLDASQSLVADATTYTIAGDLSVLSGASLTLNAGSKLTVNQDLSNAGTIALRSPASLAGSPGSLIVDGTLDNATGVMTMERYVTAGTTGADNFTWHSIGVPLTSATSGAYFMNDYLLEYLEPTNGWSNIENIETNIPAGRGYLVKTVAGNKAYTFAGTFNNSNVNVSLNNTGPNASHGYNLVANPFPSAVDLDDLSYTNMSTSAWIWDPTTETYLTYTIGSAGGTGTLGTQYVHPGQAFFVKVADASATGSVVFDKTDRVHYNDGAFYKKSKATVEKIVLAAKNNTGTDYLYIDKLDFANDAYKLFSMNPDIPNLFLADNQSDYAIWHEPALSEEHAYTLGYYSEEFGSVAISLEEITVENMDVYLKDLKNGSMTLLTEDNAKYEFDHTDNNDANRFEVSFVKQGTTSIDEQLANKNQVSWFSKRVLKEGLEINISGTPAAKLKVYDILGSVVYTGELTKGTNLIPLNKEGVYIIVAASEFGTIQEKCIFLN